MKLLRVSVPNFRNLHNVELTFEPSLKPSVFPIGSLNGGGKTTLLKLIFLLLSHHQDYSSHQLLLSFLGNYPPNLLIAKIEVLYQSRIISLDYKLNPSGRIDFGIDDDEFLNDLSRSIYWLFPITQFPSKTLDVTRNPNAKTFMDLINPFELENKGHGEAKRNALQRFIQTNQINNCILLIDEIENGLHPDWQYTIVHELASWGDNQYLLATHSFYLCEALTPGHVKQI